MSPFADDELSIEVEIPERSSVIRGRLLSPPAFAPSHLDTSASCRLDLKRAADGQRCALIASGDDALDVAALYGQGDVVAFRHSAPIESEGETAFLIFRPFLAVTDARSRTICGP